MRKAKAVAVLLCVVLVAASCATFGVNLDTPEKKYLAARSELNLLLEEYVQLQDKVSDADHLIAKKAFFEADEALDRWEGQIGNTGYNFMTDMRVWLQAKSVIIDVIRRVTQ